MTEDKIRLRLPNAREKLQSLFPEDNRGDIRIQFGERSFKLQKAFLRLQSGYFKKNFTSNIVVLSIKENFSAQYFTNILKCFYGFAIEVSRTEVIDYYPIVKFLEVQSLIKILRDDMISKAEHYDIFALMQIAHRYDQQQLFQVSLSQLEKEDFEQLRYAKMELLHCPTQLFKMVIKTHNRMKPEKGKGIPFIEINQLIKDYSDEKKMTQAQYVELKFQLIDKNTLTSQEYKQIFLDDNKKKKSSEYSSMIKIQSDPKLSNTFRENPFPSSRLTESLIHPMQKMNDELTLEMENTFEKKKNQELKAENSYLFKELEDLKEVTTKNRKMFDDLKDTVMKLQKQLDQKEKIDKDQSSTIKKLSKMCDDLRKELTEKGEVIKKLQDKVTKLQKQPEKRTGKNKYLPYNDDEGEQSRTIQTMILPSHVIKEIAKPAAEALSAPSTNGFKKAKAQPVVTVVEAKVEQEELDQDELQQMYSSRLVFDVQPRGCPKKLLPNLANFLTTDGFQKKTLNLIFRRNISNQQVKGNPNDLFEKSSLLVIICTRMNQIIGGFASIEIKKGQKDYISDDEAFIFSLSRNEKFNIKKNSASEAIFITPEYLLCFSNDLMINIDCTKTQSQSDWPCAYESGGQKRNSKWFTGQDGAFLIKQIEIYEVREEAMTMDL